MERLDEMWESIWTLGVQLLSVTQRLVDDGLLTDTDMAALDAVAHERRRADEYALQVGTDAWERGYLVLLDTDLQVRERRVEFCRLVLDLCALE